MLRLYVEIIAAQHLCRPKGVGIPSPNPFRLGLLRSLIPVGNLKSNPSCEKAATRIAPEVNDSCHNGAGRG